MTVPIFLPSLSPRHWNDFLTTIQSLLSLVSRVTSESQLAGACFHILSAPVAALSPTRPELATIGQVPSSLIRTVLSPRRDAWLNLKSMISGLQFRYIAH